ncbi:MAG: carotenoid 1,2-hydratase [Deltaproteobacteria bacterium]|nr:carotenoid 1,2-hydratase [Deltaproteobacteria bacterium]
MSEDGRYAIVVIAMIGNPFSPSYARARANGESPSAMTYSAMNVAVYGPNGDHFSLTERAIMARDTDASAMAIGPNRMRWDGGDLVLELDERSAPWPTPIRGTVRLHPECETAPAQILDAKAEHHWWPVAPSSTIEVELSAPNVRFRGHGYHDANAGDVPLEDSFSRWRWSRTRVGPFTSAIMYDTVDLEGGEHHLSIDIDREGVVRPVEMPELRDLPTTRWRLPRSTRSAGAVRVLRELEDTPFYARALLASRDHDGRELVTVHEELSCDRLRRAWVRFLLGFRMGRA